MMVNQPAIIWDIVEEHLDEASFLWSQWERTLCSPLRTISEVAEGVEERLRAHLDGLACAGAAAESLLTAALRDQEAGKVFAAAASLAGARRLDAIREAMPQTDEAGRVVGRALGLALPAGEERTLINWLNEGDQATQAVALEALAFREAVPPAALSAFLASRAPRLSEAALKAVGAHDDIHGGQVEAALVSVDPRIRDAAVGAALRMGKRSGIVASRRAVEKGESDVAFPLEVLALSGEREDFDRIAATLVAPALRPAAIWAAGLSGWPQAGDLCSRFLYDQRLGRLAFEALSCIGGPAVAQFSMLEPEESLQDEEDGEVMIAGPEAELPLPDGELVERAWQKARPGLVDTQRYLGGRPVGADELLRAFVDGPTRRRHALGLELALRSRGGYRIETRSWASQQLGAQATRKLVARSDFTAPLWRILRD